MQFSIGLFAFLALALALGEARSFIDYDQDLSGWNEDEDDDIRADFEDAEIPHPVGIYNWGSRLHLGQVSGVAVNTRDEPVIFQRGCHLWGPKTFNDKFELTDKTPIPNNTVLTLDPETAAVKSAWGKNTFYVPHGITVDSNDNVYVTDAGLHQVMRFPKGAEKPDLVLGEAFTPGHDGEHFCQPTSVAVASNGVFFVGDGYCNSRVMKFAPDGKLLKVIEGQWNVVHSLSLFEDEDVLCVADREGQKIDCLRAGLTEDGEDNEEVVAYTGLGKPYAIAARGSAIFAVTDGGQFPKGVTIDTESEEAQVMDQWGIEERLTAPHDLAVSINGDAVYVVETDIAKRDKIHKFEVVKRADFF